MHTPQQHVSAWQRLRAIVGHVWRQAAWRECKGYWRAGRRWIRSLRGRNSSHTLLVRLGLRHKLVRLLVPSGGYQSVSPTPKGERVTRSLFYWRIMTILEYLQKKYSTRKPGMMTRFEADAFGIPYPLQAGWLAKHGSAVITGYMQEKISSAFGKKAAKREKRGKSAPRFSKQSADAFASKSGPVSRPPIHKVHIESTPPKQRYVDPNSDEFLTSYAWRTLRMQALKKYGAVCMCCGDSPQNGAVMNVDHIKPRKRFPHLALDLANMQILCGACNQGKCNWDETDWRPTVPEFEIYDPLDQVKEYLKGF